MNNLKYNVKKTQKQTNKKYYNFMRELQLIFLIINLIQI